MGHQHNHDHSHGASNIKIAFLLNFAFAILEIVGGLLTNSTAILSDAVHDLGDSLALAFSFITEKASHKKESDHYNYGFKRLSLIGALVNIIVLLLGSTYVLREAVESLMNPQEVHAQGMLLLALIGIGVNGFAAFRMKGSKKILDRTVVLHLMEDLLGWLAVFVVSIVIYFSNLYILDPILSILIAGIVLRNVWMNSVQAYKIIMQGVPDMDLYKDIKDSLLGMKDISDLEDFKMWSLDGDDHVVSLHLSVQEGVDVRLVMKEVKTLLEDKHIKHSTVEFID